MKQNKINNNNKNNNIKSNDNSNEHSKIFKLIVEYILDEIEKLKKKVYCSCGAKLEPNSLDEILICPKYLKESSLLLLKSRHNTKNWGTIKHYYYYEFLKELLNKIYEIEKSVKEGSNGNSKNNSKNK